MTNGAKLLFAFSAPIAIYTTNAIRVPEQYGAPHPRSGALPERPGGDEADLPGAARRREQVAQATALLAHGPQEMGALFDATRRFPLRSADPSLGSGRKRH